MADREQDNLSELRFWLQVMGDYARFIRDALVIKEASEILEAQKYIALFDDLLSRARKPLSGDDLIEVDRQAYRAVGDFRKYILHIIGRQLTEAIIVNFTPAYLNHLVNDTEMFLDTLNDYINGRQPVLNPVDVSLNWLLNLYEAISTLQDRIGTVFYKERQQAGEFASEILNLYYGAWVLNGLRRSGQEKFPSIIQMNIKIRETMTTIGEYLVDMIKMTSEKKVVGAITLLYLENMYREVCYFLTKLEKTGNALPPACDPAAPRMETS